MSFSAHSNVLYVHGIIMFAAAWGGFGGGVGGGLSHHCPGTVARCHRMAPPAELYQQDVGEVEE